MVCLDIVKRKHNFFDFFYSKWRKNICVSGSASPASLRKWMTLLLLNNLHFHLVGRFEICNFWWWNHVAPYSPESSDPGWRAGYVRLQWWRNATTTIKGRYRAAREAKDILKIEIKLHQLMLCLQIVEAENTSSPRSHGISTRWLS